MALDDERHLKLVQAELLSDIQMQDEQPPVAVPVPPSLLVNQENIRNAWEFTVSGSEKAITDWFRRLCRVNLRESPSPSLRACSVLGERHVVSGSPNPVFNK